MSKGGGGGYDTSGMEDAARESNILNEKIYNESVERGLPWYNAGREGLGTLLDYLGLDGGDSTQSRDQLTAQFKPRFTSEQTTTSGQPNMYVNQSTGELRSYDNLNSYQKQQLEQMGGLYAGKGLQGAGTQQAFWTPHQTTQTETVTDQDALNAAVEAEYARQQEGGKPDYYGSLLQSFGMDQYEADPGYQFRLDQGQKQLERQLAAQGKTYSPEAAKALMGYNQGMASQEYGNAYNRYQNDQNTIFNRLAGISGLGQQQAQLLNQSGENYANNVNQTNTSLANAQASAAQAKSDSKGSMFGNILGLGGQLGAAWIGR